MNLLIPALGAAGLLLLSSSKSNAKTTSAKPKTAQDFQARIVDAISRNDHEALNTIANEMQREGLHAEANALRVTIQALKTTGAIGVPTTGPIAPSPAVPNPPAPAPPVVVPPVVVPSSVPLPPGVTITPEHQQRMGVAQSLAVNLRNTPRYKEDQTLVKRFQAQEGLKVDGLYGPKSALALAEYGLVPPRPRFWSSKTMKADKAAYIAQMERYAQQDPTRAADWRAAAKVSNDPVK